MRLFPLLAGIMVREIHADQTVTDGYTAETVTDNYGYDFQDTTGDTVTSIIDICPGGKSIIEVTCHEDLTIELASRYFSS